MLSGFLDFLTTRDGHAAQCAAVLLGDNDIVGHVDQTTGQITSVGGLQSGIGQTLTGTVRGDEVFQHGQTFLEVGKNRVFNDFGAARTSLHRLGHQASHAAQLRHLSLGTTSTRVKHHIHRVEALVVARQHLHHLLGEFGIDIGPKVNDLVVSFVRSHEAHLLIFTNLRGLGIGIADKVTLHLRHKHVAEIERQTALVSLIVTHILDVVKELGRHGCTFPTHHVADDATQRLLRQQFIDEAEIVRHNLVEEDAAHGGFHQLLDQLVLFADIHPHLNDGVHIGATLIVGDDDFLRRIERHALAPHGVLGRALTRLGDIVQTQNHVLRRQRDRRTIRGVQDVVRSQHQDLSLKHGGIAQRYVDSHLVTVEVGVECRTHQRVQTNCLTFNEFRLECLNTQTVQRRSTVQQNRVTFQDIFEDVPNDGILAVDNLLGRFHGLDDAALNEFANHKRLEQLGGHVLGQTTFVHVQVGTDHDNGTA